MYFRKKLTYFFGPNLLQKTSFFRSVKYLFLKRSATFTSIINTGTSTSGPITVANAAGEFIPKTATATAIANSKSLLPAVKATVVVFS